jgi:DNA primase large subunit
MMREMLTKEYLAKYPFLKEASSFVERQGLTFADFSSSGYSGVVNKAIEWLTASIEGKTFVTDLRDPDTDILAYPLTLAFVYGLKKDWLVNRFATSEQKRYDQLLKMEKPKQLVEVARDGFGWQLEPINAGPAERRLDFSLGVPEYLAVVPQFHSSTWKLVNRHLQSGRVLIRMEEAARLISGAAKNKIIRRSQEEEVKKFEIPKVFEPHLEGIRKLVEERKKFYDDEETPIGLWEEARPPCVVSIFNDLQAGKNLSHMARFTITTFLVNVGEDSEKVLELFSNVADFDEGKARYQVEHIAGKIGSRMKYKMPKCDVLRSFGLCTNPNELCEDIWHPLSYYKIKVEQVKRGSPKGGKSTA